MTLMMPDNTEIESLGELKRLWPDLVMEDGYVSDPGEDDCCLCNVDLKKSAAKHGLAITPDETWMFWNATPLETDPNVPQA